MKTTFSVASILAGIALAACSNGPGDTGGNTTGLNAPDKFYNLVPGQCAEFSNDAGGLGPTVGLQIKVSTSPPGILLQRTKHGSIQESDFVSIDGGLVYLIERELQGQTGAPQQAYVTPLQYLPEPPLAVGGSTLDSTSLCSGGSNCASMSLTTNTATSRDYTGWGSTPDAGLTEYKVNFVFNNTLADGGSTTETDETWITPGIGFTDLFLESDQPGTFTDYTLVDIITDGGPCAEH